MRDPVDERAASRRVEGFLGELGKALKAAAFYPSSHPALRRAIERTAQALRAAFGRDGDPPLERLELAVSRRGFALDDRPVGERLRGVPELAHECAVRRVSRLFFRPDATADDLARLVRLLTVEPERLAAAGGLDRCLAAEGVRAIWVNELELDRILEKLSDRPAPELAVQPGGDREAEPPPEADPEPPTPEAALLELLARLERESDPAGYHDTLAELRPHALALRRDRAYDLLLPALAVLGQHASGAGRRPPPVQQMADALIADLVDDDLLAWLVRRVAAHEARGEREILGGVLRRLGARALPPLLDALSASADRHARRALAQVVGLFGESAVPELELRLRDDRWFVVRNMVSLLGEVGSRRSVPVVAEMLGHADSRVRRAALQALARIGGSEATGHLVRCLMSGDVELQVQAILTLGARRETSALPALEAIARGGSAAGGGRRQRDPEVRRYAIEALGRIGGLSAFRVLADLLEGGSFWRRLFGRGEGDLVRLAAAEALAAMGGPLAKQALTAAAARRGGVVAARCRELASRLQ